MIDFPTSPKAESVLQLKAGLPGTSPMIWRHLLVWETMPLHELHGVLRVAMGWEAIRLFQFNIRGIMHAGPHLHGEPVDVSLSDFRFWRNGKFRCIYGMHCRRERELRVEDRVSATPGKRYPVCIGGSRACPAGGLRWRRPVSRRAGRSDGPRCHGIRDQLRLNAE